MTEREQKTRRRRQDALPAGAASGRPLVAVVGRPNVGKSTLFNRLAGRRIAIVEDVPGVTRDRHYADTEALGREFVLIDTGGFDPRSDDPMAASIAGQVELAVNECDLVVCVVDGSVDPMPADREAVALLRKSKKPTLFVANKVDSSARESAAMAYYELGIDNIFPVSALHGHGMGDFEEALAARLPILEDPAPVGGEGAPRIAVIGQPNAGKSSLVNQWLGEERLLVDSRPGTTVDSIDSLLHHEGDEVVIIDTAGMRRKRAVENGAEGLGVLQAIRAMERSHAVVMMIDAHRGAAEQDARILGLAEERGRAIVVGLNKMDLLDEEGRKKAIQHTRETLNFVPWAPIIGVSAKSGRATQKLLGAAKSAVAEHAKRVSTGELNRFFEEVLITHPPPTHGGKSVRLYYVTQAQVRPPTFIAMSNFPDKVHWSYQRYVVNAIRARFGFEGTSIRVRYRGKKKNDPDAM